MHNGDKLSWPPSRADIVMLVGLSLMVYAGWRQVWEVVALGAALLILGYLLPRMRGPFSLGGPRLNFQGELTDPEPDGQVSQQRRLPGDVVPGRLLPSDLPESSQLQQERSQ